MLLIAIAALLIVQRSRVAVQILTGGGEKRAYIHRDRKLVSDITEALNTEVINYGRAGSVS